ncbi:MAG TPA: hypothetical protein VFZ32_07600 [Micromonosporaceae bacterium]
MRGKMTFLVGVAIGYVLGSRAGRERYEQIVRAAERVKANPTVQEAAGMVQAQTTRLVNTGRDVVRSTMNDRLGSTRFANSRVGPRPNQDTDTVTIEERPPRDTMGF